MAAAPAPVVLHVGLPKTGTTHLQHQIFARCREITFLHRRRGSAAGRQAAAELRHLVTRPWPLSLLVRRRLARHLAAAAAEGRPVVVSNENVAMSARGLWTGKGDGPEQAARRIGALARSLAPHPVRVVIGIRAQAPWLASRYAESSRALPDFGQEDFDRRLAGIAARREFSGAEAWLDHARVHAAFAAELGAGNVFLLPVERLRDEAAYAELGAFVGGVDLARLQRRVAAATAERPRNALARPGGWMLRGDGGMLVLDPALAEALDARFAASNRTLAARAPLGLIRDPGDRPAPGPSTISR